MSAPDDTPVVLLPGMDGTGRLLADVEVQLLRRRRVQVISYPADPSLGYDALTALVLRHLPSKRFVIVGELFSGPIAIEVAASEPQRAAGLVLVSSFARSPVPAALTALARRLDLRWVPRRAIDVALLGRGGTLALKASLHNVLATLPRDVIRRRAAEIGGVDKRERLRLVACPILCVVGSRDRLAGGRCATEIAQARPGCAVHVLDAPHMLMQTHAAEAAKLIDAFCEQLV